MNSFFDLYKSKMEGRIVRAGGPVNVKMKVVVADFHFRVILDF